MKGVFLNAKVAVCSIYESGLMAYKALALSEKYDLDYADSPVDLGGYDFVIANHHPAVLNWITKDYLQTCRGPSFAIVLEMWPHNPLPMTPRIYDHYLCLDPSMQEASDLHSFPRPIEIVEDLPPLLEEEIGIPVIGSFGFATQGKRWDLIIEEVQKDFDEALIRINIPYNTYRDASVSMEQIKSQCFELVTKPGVKLEFTHNNMNKEELIKWCAQNTINVFFYWRNLAGLAAVTDQAVSSRRPLLVSDDPTFRHIHPYCGSYPNIGIKEAIQKNKRGVDEMYEDWLPERFMKKFESLL